MSERIYLDHNATTPVAPEVLEAMLPYFREHFGNASSIHGFGREARNTVDTAREQVAELLGAQSPSEIVFTSGGTESDNQAIRGIAAYHEKRRGKHVISAQTEHHAVLHTCQWIEQQGFDVTYVPVDRYGRVDLGAMCESIREDTVLITLMHANNETGTLNPIDEIGTIAQEYGILFHTDAVQSTGKIPIDLENMRVDLLTLSAHKIYGPKGIGALYIRRGTRLSPLILGGSHERNRRAGTENVPGIVGFGRAASLALKELEPESVRLRSLLQQLEIGLTEQIQGIHINTDPEHRLPNTLSVSFEKVAAETLILALDMEGIAVSSGSACTSGSLEPSHVLQALKLDPRLAQGTLRFSLGRDNDASQIERTVDTVARLVKRVRSL